MVIDSVCDFNGLWSFLALYIVWYILNSETYAAKQHKEFAGQYLKYYVTLNTLANSKQLLNKYFFAQHNTFINYVLKLSTYQTVI